MFSTDVSQLANQEEIMTSYRALNKDEILLQVLDISARQHSFEICLFSLGAIYYRSQSYNTGFGSLCQRDEYLRLLFDFRWSRNRAIQMISADILLRPTIIQLDSTACCLLSVAEGLDMDPLNLVPCIIESCKPPEWLWKLAWWYWELSEICCTNVPLRSSLCACIPADQAIWTSESACSGAATFKNRAPWNDRVWIQVGAVDSWRSFHRRLPPRPVVRLKMNNPTVTTQRLCLLEVYTAWSHGILDSWHGMIRIFLLSACKIWVVDIGTILGMVQIMAYHKKWLINTRIDYQRWNELY